MERVVIIPSIAEVSSNLKRYNFEGDEWRQKEFISSRRLRIRNHKRNKRRK